MDQKAFSTMFKTVICFFSTINIAFAWGNTHIDSSVITKNGLYLGGAIGVADLMNKESHAIQPESHQLGSVGLIGGGFIGYDFGMTDIIHLALEFFADGTNLKTGLQHSSYTYNMKQNYNLGLRVLPEYIFTPFTAIHLIFGYANGRFNIDDNGVYGLINKTYNLGGFQTGIGFNTALTNNTLIRLDALYNIYPSHTNQGLGLSSPTQIYTNKFSQLAGELSIIYKFTH